MSVLKFQLFGKNGYRWSKMANKFFKIQIYHISTMPEKMIIFLHQNQYVLIFPETVYFLFDYLIIPTFWKKWPPVVKKGKNYFFFHSKFAHFNYVAILSSFFALEPACPYLSRKSLLFIL